MKYSKVIIFLVFVMFGSNVNANVDVSGKWKKHIIGSNINRDYGVGPAIGDLNGDGRMDALIAYGSIHNPEPEDGVWWYEAPEDPTIQNWTKRRITDPSMPIRWSLAVSTGDLDNDGDLDVVALSFNDGKVFLAINPLMQGGNVNETWQTLVIQNSGSRHGEFIHIIDVDKDGFNDIVFNNVPSAHILFNPAGDLTKPWVDKQVYGGIPDDAHSVYAADIDGDGDMDLASATCYAPIYWYEHPDGNPRNGTWTRHKVSTMSGCYGALQIDDVDNDGFLDILATEAHGHPGKIYWYKNPNTINGLWERYTIGEQTYPHGSSLVDVDGDGKNEFWVGDSSNGWCSGGGYCWHDGGVVYLKQDNASTELWTKYVVAAAPETGRQSQAVDIDLDGDLDMVSTGDHTCTGSKPASFIPGVCHISLVWWENGLSNVGDTEAPTKPQNVSASTIKSKEIKLTWFPSTDNVGVSGYKVYRNSNPASIGTTSSTNFTDTGLTANTNYTYEVLAVDRSANESVKSDPFSVITGDVSKLTTINITPALATIVVNLTKQFSAEGFDQYGNTSFTMPTWEVTGGGTIDQSTGLFSAKTLGNSFTVTATDGLITGTTTFTVVDVNSGFLDISISSVYSTNAYEVVSTGIFDGKPIYTDRGYNFASVPPFIQGAVYIKTANSDKAGIAERSIVLNANKDVTVYVAYDDRIIMPPDWLQLNFTKTANSLTVAGSSHSLWKKEYSAGEIVLGGNDGGGNSMYSVIIMTNDTSPIDISPPKAPTDLRIK